MCCTSGPTSYFSYYLSGYFLALCLCYLLASCTTRLQFFSFSLRIFWFCIEIKYMDFCLQLPSTWCHRCLQISISLLSQEFLINLLHLATGLRMFSSSKTLALGHTPSVQYFCFSVWQGLHCSCLPPQIGWNKIFHQSNSIAAKRGSRMGVTFCNR